MSARHIYVGQIVCGLLDEIEQLQEQVKNLSKLASDQSAEIAQKDEVIKKQEKYLDE